MLDLEPAVMGRIVRGPAPLAVGFLAALAIAASAAASTQRQHRPAGRASVSRTTADRHTDPAGDSGVTPDVTTIDVGNDVVAGPYVMWILLANRSALNPDDGVIIYLNTDLNEATGTGPGIDYAILFNAPDTCILTRATGTDFEQIPAPSLQCGFVPAEKSLRVEIQPSDIGGTRAFNFFIVTMAGTTYGDVAPDSGVLSYSAVSPPVKLTLDAWSVAPKSGSVLARMTVGRDDIFETLATGVVSCSLKVGSKTLPATTKGFVNGDATCKWTVPKSARKKALRGVMKVSFGGSVVTKSFSVTAP
jgi:hypothetical protein